MPLNLEKYQRCLQRIEYAGFLFAPDAEVAAHPAEETQKTARVPEGAVRVAKCNLDSSFMDRSGSVRGRVQCCTTPLAKHTFWLRRSCTSPGFQTRASSARPWARPSPSTISSGGADGRDPPVELTGVIMRYHAVLQSNLALGAVDELPDSWIFLGDEISGRFTGSVPPESLAAAALLRWLEARTPGPRAPQAT